ncbi:MAG: carboxypeptidase-like regulatory domain-containing protein [Bacteroidales bacterium]|nr:carboxypeptidase-like regulatory domain-containing protein [Bacteroidales bacterium]
MKRSLVVILLFTISCSLFSQKISISGYVTDAKTGERLMDAVIVDTLSKAGTYANEHGFYSLSVSGDSAVLEVSYIGYSTIYRTVGKVGAGNVNFALDPSIMLGEVVVSDKSIPIDKDMGALSLTPTEARTLPSLAGEHDLIRTMQLLPGIGSGGDGNSNIFVRGGDDSQNLILLDGVQLYGINHVYGFLSIFNGNALSRLKVYSGGFPARYSGRLSSVVDVRTRDGNRNGYHGNVSVGLVSANVLVEGPIWKGRTSFMVSLRRTMLDLTGFPIVMAIMKKIQNDEKLRLSYYFYDINLKLSHTCKNDDKIALSFYMGDDRYLAEQVEDFGSGHKTVHKWGNIATNASWTHAYGKKLFSELSLSYGRYRGKMYESNLLYYVNYIPWGGIRILTDSIIKGNDSEFTNSLNDVMLRMDWDWKIDSHNYVRFGFNNQSVFFNPGNTVIHNYVDWGNNSSAIAIGDIYTKPETQEEIRNMPKTISGDGYVYVEDEMKYGRFEANVGLNFSCYLAGKKIYPKVQPRLQMKVNAAEGLSFLASYTEMTQNVHLLSQNTMDLSLDVWLPSTATIKPMSARQVAAGVDWQFARQFGISLEGYYKTMSNLLEYKDGVNGLNRQTDWESLVEVGKGHAYGVEFLFKKKSGVVSGWISYAYSRSIRQFDNLNRGQAFPYRYDRPHNLSVVAIWNVCDWVNISATWVYYTGAAYTMPATYYPVLSPDGDVIGGNIKEYPARNSFRMPDYHRLDVSASFTKKKKHGTNVWSVGVYNLYNRKNPYYMYPSTNEITGKSELVYMCILPLIPFVNYEFKF